MRKVSIGQNPKFALISKSLPFAFLFRSRIIIGTPNANRAMKNNSIKYFMSDSVRSIK